MDFPYTENDTVLKESLPERLIELFSSRVSDGDEAALGEKLTRLFEEARTGGKHLSLPERNLTLGWDDGFDQYFIVIHGLYDPENLMAILYERLVRFEKENLGEDIAECADLINRYIGVIEKKEKIDLAEIKSKLTETTSKMKETVYLFLEEQFNEEDIEKLSKALDHAYYEPITEMLEGVLVTIAGR
jgi:hypothetical protein